MRRITLEEEVLGYAARLDLISGPSTDAAYDVNRARRLQRLQRRAFVLIDGCPQDVDLQCVRVRWQAITERLAGAWHQGDPLVLGTAYTEAAYRELVDRLFTRYDAAMRHQPLAGYDGITITDADAMNREHPDTFHVPALEDVARLQPGDAVKVGFTAPSGMGERMWVKLTGRDGDTFTGTLDNQPVTDLAGLIGAGDALSFHSRNILDIDPVGCSS